MAAVTHGASSPRIIEPLAAVVLADLFFGCQVEFTPETLAEATGIPLDELSPDTFDDWYRQRRG
jgi:hypothetical protein